MSETDHGIAPEAVAYMQRLLRLLRHQRENETEQREQDRRLQGMVVAVNPYHTFNDVSDGEVDEDDFEEEEVFGAQPDDLRDRFNRRFVRMEMDNVDDDGFVHLVAVDVPINEIRRQDPEYVWLQDVTQEMNRRLQEGAFHPNISDAESETFDSHNDPWLQQMLDQEITMREEREKNWLAYVYKQMLKNIRKGENDFDHLSHATDDDGIDNSAMMEAPEEMEEET